MPRQNLRELSISLGVLDNHIIHPADKLRKRKNRVRPSFFLAASLEVRVSDDFLAPLKSLRGSSSHSRVSLILIPCSSYAVTEINRFGIPRSSIGLTREIPEFKSIGSAAYFSCSFIKGERLPKWRRAILIVGPPEQRVQFRCFTYKLRCFTLKFIFWFQKYKSYAF